VPGFNDGIIGPSKKLGTAVRDAYKAGTTITYSTYLGVDGVTVRDDLGGLNLSKVPKVFIETGNMKNPGDAAKLSTGTYRQRIAVALATGLTNYLRAK
jgi:N-acetylmuramoyl-L-alanine amidase